MRGSLLQTVHVLISDAAFYRKRDIAVYFKDGRLPKISANTNNTMKMEKNILAMSIAATAIPPNLKIAAMIAITRKRTPPAQHCVLLKFPSSTGFKPS
jgi:hypothetical protein